MKLFLFLILVLPLSAQKSFQFELINEKDIPALGEKTEHERALAKSLNKIIKRWNANGNSDDYQSRYSGYIKPYNDALAECKISETENIYYGCMKDKIKSISLYFIADSMGYEANQINIDPVPTAKALKTCAQILNSKFFLQKADDYVSYNASGMKHFVVTKYQGTAGVSYFYHKAVDMDANESIFSIRNLIGDVDFDPMDEDWVGIYRKPLNANGVKMFSWNDTIYMSINNRDKSEYDIYVYDKESRFFDHACEIKRKITGYKNSEKICRQVIKGGYEKIA
ncbi:MAG: hypothetical protein LBP54_05610, partial [Campylobacteraceae bacterium]|nr:hypothetical protein [Campylobacteraceae bacterium]